MKEADIRPKALLDEFFAYMKADAERLAARRADFVDVPCPGCGGSDAALAFEKDGFPYQECRTCHSLFASPRPSPEALIDYAMNSRAVEFWSTHFYRQTADARRAQIFRPRAGIVAELVKNGTAGGGTFVDVGAGYGLFLQEIAATGAFTAVRGIEPDRRLAQVCRDEGFDTLETWVEDMAPGTVDADFATAFEVLEHTYDPQAFIRACGALLKPGGVLLFTTLSISGFDLLTLWQHSRQISPPQHLNFLSTQGIELLTRRAGLEVVELATPGQLDVDIVRNASIADPSLDIGRFARAIVNGSDETRRDFQAFLRAHRLSSHVRCIARRPA